MHTTTIDTLKHLMTTAGIPYEGNGGDAYSLLDDEGIDSFSKISMYMEIESEFGVMLMPQDMLKPEFRTVSGLARLIDQSLMQTGSAA